MSQVQFLLPTNYGRTIWIINEHYPLGVFAWNGDSWVFIQDTDQCEDLTLEESEMIKTKLRELNLEGRTIQEHDRE